MKELLFDLLRDTTMPRSLSSTNQSFLPLSEEAQEVDEEVDDVDVELEGRQDVLVALERVVRVRPVGHALGVVDNVP